MAAAINKITPVIKERQAELAIGIGDRFNRSSAFKIAQLWDQFVTCKDQICNVKPGYTIGICESPSSQHEQDDMFIYTAAVPVDRAEEMPPGMVLCKIPQGRYAVFTHKGIISNLANTLGYIHGDWFPASGYTRPVALSDILHFELYDSRFDPDDDNSEVDVYVPIQ